MVMRGRCPGGVLILGVLVLWDSCHWGSCPKGSCPQGSCPRGGPRMPSAASYPLSVMGTRWPLLGQTPGNQMAPLS